jgi:hypothetical protein
VDDDAQRIDRLFIEELKEADRTPTAAVIAAIAAIVTPTGQVDGVGAMGVGLLGEKKERVLTGTGKDARHEERQPAKGEDRHRGEAAGKALAHPEQAEALTPVPDDGLDPPRPGDIGVTSHGRFVPLGQTVEK